MPSVLFDWELRGYQEYATKKCKQLKGLLLAIDMSLGKTAAVLTYLLWVWERYFKVKVLIVAPLLVATDTWPDEIHKWRHLRPLRKHFAVMCGTEEERRAALNTNTFIYIINKENLQWLWEEIGGDGGWFWDILVIDEASMLKDGKKRTKRKGGGKGSMPLSRFGILARARKLCWRVIEMTGTPAPEGIHNMWGLMYLIDLGERLGRDKDAFERRWFDKGYMGYGMKPHKWSTEEITDLCSDVTISLSAEDHIKLPPVITHPDTTKWVTFSPELIRRYKKFERDLYDELADVEAVTRGVAVNKLLQFANGSMYRERGNAIHVHDLKINALEEMLEGLDGEHALIAYSFHFDRDTIMRRFGKRIKLFEDYGKNAIKDWNAGKIRWLLCHPKNLSHGTNLQFGGHNQIWYGLQESGETARQFNMRLARPGQEAEHCYIRHILARGTRDEVVMANQAAKAGVEGDFRRAVRVTKEDVDRELQRGRG